MEKTMRMHALAEAYQQSGTVLLLSVFYKLRSLGSRIIMKITLDM